MSRVAIFVDAGYLFAQGSVVLAGSKQPREVVSLDIAATVLELTRLAQDAAEGANLLRVYWYDGVSKRGPTSDHRALAEATNVKIRLGALNSAGEQKGVDSLIVIDLIDLARNHAITDALLVSGDEDVRVGVQVAQTFGVRVHLLGLEPARGSQSIDLICEADTTHEWSRETVSRVMAIRPREDLAPAVPDADIRDPEAVIQRTSQALAEQVTPADAPIILSKSDGELRRRFDGQLLASNRRALGRDLDAAEKKSARQLFRAALTAKTR